MNSPRGRQRNVRPVGQTAAAAAAAAAVLEEGEWKPGWEIEASVLREVMGEEQRGLGADRRTRQHREYKTARQRGCGSWPPAGQWYHR